MTAAQFFANWAVRSSILIITGALLLPALRVKNPAVKLAAWRAMLLGSLSIPLLMAILPTLPLPAIPRQAHPAVLSVPANLTAGPMNVAPLPIGILRPGSGERSFDWMRAVAFVYLSVAGFLMLRLFVGLAMAVGIIRQSLPTNLRWEGIEVRESDALSSPVTMGVLRPVVVLSADWRQWDASSLNAVLAHETAHVRRRDPAVQALSAMHRALLWLNPLSWVLHRQLVRLAEEASDEAAVAATQDRCSYAEVLLGFMQRGTRRASWHGAAMAHYDRPEARISRILNASGFSRGLTPSGVALILCVAAPLACLVAAGRADAAQPSREIARQAQTEAAQSSNASPSIAKQTAPATQKSSTVPAKAEARGASTAMQPAIAGQGSANIQRYIVVDSNSMSGSWDTNDTDVEGVREKFGRHFAWFRANGNEYVITDPGVLEEFRKANAPQEEVNKMQADVNAHQSVVNDMQSEVNVMQKNVNDLQHKVNVRQDIANRIQSSVNHDDKEALMQKLQQAEQDVRDGRADSDQSTVNREQAKVNEVQQKVNAKQAEVNELQHKVNDQQQRVNVEYRRRVQEIFQSAMSRGLAQQLM
jgi:hypothetical protein